MRGTVVVFAALGLALVAAARLLPWWALPALFACLVLTVVALFKWGLRRLLLIPFRAKGAVLRDAAVDVHAIERAERPAPTASGDSETTSERGPLAHARLEFTVAPRAAHGPFTLWEPGELRLVGPEARAGEPRPGEASFDVVFLEVLEDGRFEPDRGMKYGGPQRLRLLVAVPPGQRRLRIRYYFDVFGSLPLPGPTAADAFRRRPITTAR